MRREFFSQIVALLQSNQCPAAIQLADQELRTSPLSQQIHGRLLRYSHAPAPWWSFLGIFAATQKWWQHAVRAFQLQIAAEPESAQAHMHLGAAYGELRKFAESARELELALKILPGHPDIHGNLALTYFQSGDVKSAHAHIEAALAGNPQQANFWNTLGMILAAECKSERAIKAYSEAIARDPKDDFYRNRALSYLIVGDFDHGWEDYEHRWGCVGFQRKNLNCPRWRGESLQGKSIYVYAEQGLGDTIMFVRMLDHLKKQGATILFEGHAAMLPSMILPNWVDHWLPAGAAPTDCDYEIPLISIPHVLGLNLDNLPTFEKYLTASETANHYWSERLTKFHQLRVGLCWQGNPNHTGDRWRSIPLKEFAELFDCENVQFFSLQQGFSRDQLQEIYHPILDIMWLIEHRGGSLDETAAVLNHLDLVIACDTAVAHLAGALARPTWVLLATNNDWRWLQHRTDSPWYPTMRLFRQTEQGKWPTPIQQVKKELIQLAQHKRAAGM
ncbi:MAG: tetratricopeptide repeat protein [Zavarzinella sp.]